MSKWHDRCTVVVICGEPKRLVSNAVIYNDQIDERQIAAALFELITSNSSPDWFTEQELAIHFCLVNKDGKPVTAGIKRWVARHPKITLTANVGCPSTTILSLRHNSLDRGRN